MVILSRTCVACRKLIPEDFAGLVFSLVNLEAKWNAKKHRHTAKLPTKEEAAIFCPDCAMRMKDIVKGQEEKGVKVI